MARGAARVQRPRPASSTPATRQRLRLGLSSAWNRARTMPRPLALLLAVALVQGVAWTALTPPLQGPDESEHVAYTQQLAETGHGPKTAGGTGVQSGEQSLVGYGLNLLPLRGHLDGRPPWGALPSVTTALDRLPASARKDGTGPNAVGQNPPLYYALQAVVYRLSPDRSLLARMTLMRLANVLLYVGAVGLAWMLAGELFARAWLRTLATSLVVLHPKLVSLAGYVNPDMLLVVLSTGFLVAAVRLVRRGATPGRVATTAALAGAAALTHGRGFFLLPPAIVAIAIACLRLPRPRLKTSARLAGLGAALFAVPAILAVLWTRSDTGGSAFGGQISQTASQAFNIRQFASYLWQFFFPRLSFMDPMVGPPYGYRQVFIETFFGGWGNYEVNFSASTYDLLRVAAYVGLIALLVTTVVRWRELVARWPTVTVVVVTVVSLLGLLLITNYRDVSGGGSPLITGRYLLPGISLFAIAIAWVVGSLPRRVGPIAGALLIAMAALLAVEGLLLNIQRFYG